MIHIVVNPIFPKIYRSFTWQSYSVPVGDRGTGS